MKRKGRVAERHTRRFQKPLGLARGGSNPPAPTKGIWDWTYTKEEEIKRSKVADARRELH